MTLFDFENVRNIVRIITPLTKNEKWQWLDMFYHFDINSSFFKRYHLISKISESFRNEY